MQYWICNNSNFPFQLKVLLIFLKKIRPMESAVRGQVEALLLKDNSIEVCVETNGNYKEFNIPNDLFSAEFNDIDDSYMEERLLQKIPFGVEI